MISTEGRAKYNAYTSEEDRDIYKGLTFWSPNVQYLPGWAPLGGAARKPFRGRGSYLTGRLGVEFIEGIKRR